MTLLYLPKAGPTAKIIENMTLSRPPQGWSHSLNPVFFYIYDNTEDIKLKILH